MNEDILKIKNEYFGVNKKKKFIICILIVCIMIAIMWSLNTGPSKANFHTIWNVLTNAEGVTKSEKVIVMGIRIPRILTTILAGILLSNSGLLMQGIFQNPLVSPYTLGVSNGASCGASLAIVFSSQLAFLHLDNYLVSVFAFIFAALTMVMVQWIGKLAKDSSKSLLLAGMAIGYLFSAVVSFIKYVCDAEKLPDLVFWQMGDVSNSNWNQIFIMFVICIICVSIMVYKGWDLNVMSTGEESAVSLGVNYKQVRKLAFIICTLMTGVAVAFVGIIGFVGMVAPHLARMIVGNDYRYTVPISSLCGALMLLLADTICRSIVSVVSLPIGVITSFIGVPFFIWLIIRKKDEV